MFKLYKKSGNDLYDFTDFCGSIFLRSNITDISEELTFDINGKFLNESDIILLYEDDKKVYEGIVVTCEQDEYNSSLSCYDYGFYLNKSEDIYQFNDIVSNCIKKILNDYGIPVGGIIDINLNYKNVNKGTLANIIKELIDYTIKNTGKKYYFQMRENKFYLEEETNNITIFKTSLFTGDLDITNFIKNPKYKKSIENLKNAIKVVQEEDNKIKQLAYAQNQDSINKYGKLQKLETLTKEEIGSASNVANTQLSLLNKVEYIFTCELPGIINCRANKILKFDDDILNVKGDFRISQCTHNITTVSHTMSLQLEVI